MRGGDNHQNLSMTDNRQSKASPERRHRCKTDSNNYLQTSESFRFLGGELKSTKDETLFLELALRGYDLSRLRDDEATGEVVKIG